MAENNRIIAEKDKKFTLALLEMVIEDVIENEKISEIASFFISNNVLNIVDILLSGFCVVKSGICNSCERFVVHVINKQNMMN